MRGWPIVMNYILSGRSKGRKVRKSLNPQLKILETMKIVIDYVGPVSQE